MTMLNQAKLNKISTALRNKNAIGKSALAATALLSLLGSPAFAAEENNNNAAEEVEVIEVKGMRGTMSRSLNIKKILPRSPMVFQQQILVNYLVCLFLMLLKILLQYLVTAVKVVVLKRLFVVWDHFLVMLHLMVVP